MQAYNVTLLIQENPNFFNARIVPVVAQCEREARLEAIADYVTLGGDAGAISKVKAREVLVDGPVRISKTPTLTGLSPVSF